MIRPGSGSPATELPQRADRGQISAVPSPRPPPASSRSALAERGGKCTTLRRAGRQFPVRESDRVHFLPAAQMDWIEADGNYVVLHAGQRRHRLRLKPAGTHRAATDDVVRALPESSSEKAPRRAAGTTRRSRAGSRRPPTLAAAASEWFGKVARGEAHNRDKKPCAVTLLGNGRPRASCDPCSHGGYSEA